MISADDRPGPRRDHQSSGRERPHRRRRRPRGSGPWTLSTDRAQLTRELLAAAGVRDARIDRVTGKADRNPVVEDPENPRNRRVEITLLRRFNK